MMLQLYNEDTIKRYVGQATEASKMFMVSESFESQPLNIKYNEKLDTTIFQIILQEADKPNRNGRVYTKNAIAKALRNPFIQEKLRKRTWYGENGRRIAIHCSDAMSKIS